jgi:hypothetical protein
MIKYGYGKNAIESFGEVCSSVWRGEKKHSPNLVNSILVIGIVLPLYVCLMGALCQPRYFVGKSWGLW